MDNKYDTYWTAGLSLRIGMGKEKALWDTARNGFSKICFPG